MGEKEGILSKFNIKDYRNELELIIEGKNFDEEAQSLILSIFYKLDNFYKDYTLVKSASEPKSKYIEEFINTIKLRCNRITILTAQESAKDGKYIVDRQKGKIKCFPSENILLYALYELNEKYEVSEKYELKDFPNKCINYVLNKGKTVNSMEPIRDFNGWSWNCEISNPENIVYNLIFQNMLILFGYDFVKKYIDSPNIMEVLKNKIDKEKYNEAGYEFLENLSEICIDIYNNVSETNHEECLKCKESINRKVKILKNREEYINKKSKNNANFIKKIQKIDRILNDVSMTQRVFDKNLKEGKIKCYTISDFIDYLEKRREKLLKKIDDNNKLLSPKEYLKNYEEYKSMLDLYSSIRENNDKVNLQNKLLKLQKSFLKCEKHKIQKEDNKKNLYSLAGEFRYYSNIPYNKNKKVIFQEKIKDEYEEVSRELIYKMVENKVIDIGFKTKKMNYDIIKYVFKTRIIKLDNLAIKLKFIKGKQVEVEYYDGKTLEYKETFNIPLDEEITSKRERKNKLFKIGG